MLCVHAMTDWSAMMQKALVATLSTLFVIGLCPPREARCDEDPGKQASSKSHEVVSANVEGKTLTVKLVSGEAASSAPQTLDVEAKALTSLKDVKEGDKISLKCKEGTGDTPSGHESTPETSGDSAEGSARCVVVEIEKVP
jgi:hypothetical protein